MVRLRSPVNPKFGSSTDLRISYRGIALQALSATVRVVRVHPAVAVVVDQIRARRGPRRAFVGGRVDRCGPVVAVGGVGRDDPDLIDVQGIERRAARAVGVLRADGDRAAQGKGQGGVLRQ